jgi:hypothetical protein
MKAFFNFLAGAGTGTLVIWVNKVIGLFAGSSLSLLSWQHEADITAGAFGTGVAFVLAAIAVWLLPRWLRPIVAFVFLLGSLFLAWRCTASHDLLSSTRMARLDSDHVRALWRLEYIGMLLSFVAALTCAAAAWWSDQKPSNGRPGDVDATDAAGDARINSL